MGLGKGGWRNSIPRLGSRARPGCIYSASAGSRARTRTRAYTQVTRGGRRRRGAQSNTLLGKAEGRRPLYLSLAAGCAAAFGRDRATLSLDGAVDAFVEGLSAHTVGLCRQTYLRSPSSLP